MSKKKQTAKITENSVEQTDNTDENSIEQPDSDNEKSDSNNTEQSDNNDEQSADNNNEQTADNKDEQPESAEQKEIERFMKGYTSVVNIKKSAEDFKNNKLFEDIENDEKDDKEEQ